MFRPSFNFVMILTQETKENNFRVSRDSWVEYKIIFLINVVFGVAVVAS